MEAVLKITATRCQRFIKQSNPWNVYFCEISSYTNSPAFAKLLANFTHACSVLFFYQIRNFMFVPLACVIMSILYYEYDLKHQTGYDFKSRLMRFHHKGSITVLAIAYVLEPVDTLLSFYYLELSNIPLYLTGLVVMYNFSDYHVFVCYVLEAVSFLVLRGFYFGASIFGCSSWIIFVSFIGIYLISMVWTLKIWFLCIKKWYTLNGTDLKNE
jgi:hypothetical protein